MELLRPKKDALGELQITKRTLRARILALGRVFSAESQLSSAVRTEVMIN